MVRDSDVDTAKRATYGRVLLGSQSKSKREWPTTKKGDLEQEIFERDVSM